MAVVITLLRQPAACHNKVAQRTDWIPQQCSVLSARWNKSNAMNSSQLSLWLATAMKIAKNGHHTILWVRWWRAVSERVCTSFAIQTSEDSSRTFKIKRIHDVYPIHFASSTICKIQANLILWSVYYRCTWFNWIYFNTKSINHDHYSSRYVRVFFPINLELIKYVQSSRLALEQTGKLAHICTIGGLELTRAERTFLQQNRDVPGLNYLGSRCTVFGQVLSIVFIFRANDSKEFKWHSLV